MDSHWVGSFVPAGFYVLSPLALLSIRFAQLGAETYISNSCVTYVPARGVMTCYLSDDVAAAWRKCPLTTFCPPTLPGLMVHWEIFMGAYA